MTDSQKKRTRRTFSDEFKREAVALYRSSDVSAEQVGAELGVSASLLYRWSRDLSESNAQEGATRILAWSVTHSAWLTDSVRMVLKAQFFRPRVEE